MQSLIGRKAPAFVANAVLNGNQITEGFSLEQFVDENVCCPINGTF